MDEVIDGFDLRLAGEEQIDGVPVWVIEGAPQRGYKFKSSESDSVLSKMKGLSGSPRATISLSGSMLKLPARFRLARCWRASTKVPGFM
jgi:hypothetical protein